MDKQHPFTQAHDLTLPFSFQNYQYSIYQKRNPFICNMLRCLSRMDIIQNGHYSKHYSHSDPERSEGEESLKELILLRSFATLRMTILSGMTNFFHFFSLHLTNWRIYMIYFICNVFFDNLMFY